MRDATSAQLVVNKRTVASHLQSNGRAGRPGLCIQMTRRDKLRPYACAFSKPTTDAGASHGASGQAGRTGASCVANRRAAPRACLRNSETAKFSYLYCTYFVLARNRDRPVISLGAPKARAGGPRRHTPRRPRRLQHGPHPHGQGILTGVTPAKLSSFLGFGGEQHFPEAPRRGLMRQVTPPLTLTKLTCVSVISTGLTRWDRQWRRFAASGFGTRPCRCSRPASPVNEVGITMKAFHRSAIEPSSVGNGVRLVERLKRAGSRTRGPPQPVGDALKQPKHIPVSGRL
jgi:hypothetical protein